MTTNKDRHPEIPKIIGSVTFACQGLPHIPKNQTAWKGSELSKTGCRQAENLHTTLLGNHFDKVFSAATQSASTTAQIATTIVAKMIGPFGIPNDSKAKTHRLLELPSLRHAPLVGVSRTERSYFNHQLGPSLQEWGRVAFDHLLDEALTLVDEQIGWNHGVNPQVPVRPVHVFVCSQSVAASTMALTLHARLGHPRDQIPAVITSHRLAPCEALKIVFTHGHPYTTLLKPDPAPKQAA